LLPACHGPPPPSSFRYNAGHCNGMPADDANREGIGFAVRDEEETAGAPDLGTRAGPRALRPRASLRARGGGGCGYRAGTSHSRLSLSWPPVARVLPSRLNANDLSPEVDPRFPRDETTRPAPKSGPGSQRSASGVTAS